MNVALTDLLPLIGRLDATPGFDTPRERFRRFLLEHVTDVAVAETLLDECQRLVGEQRHRVLQDLVVLMGRFLGFDITFGTYETGTGGPRVDGRWKSHGTLSVVLEVRSDQTTDATADGLAHTVNVVTHSPGTESIAHLGLIVVSRHYMARSRLERTLGAGASSPSLRLLSTRSLIVLAKLAAEGRLQHPEVVKLLQSSHELELVIDLLARQAADLPGFGSSPSPVAVQPTLPPPSTTPAEPLPLPVVKRDPLFWVVSNIDMDLEGTDFLSTVVGRRHLLGVGDVGTPQSEGAPDDWVCFFLPTRGMVGHAQLLSIVDRGVPVIRNGDLYHRVFRLAHVEIYDEPVVAAMRADRPFRIPSDGRGHAGPRLSPISRQDFVAFTRNWTEGESGLRAGDAGRESLFVSDRTMRSHGSARPT